jgi:hypothetical protein
MTLLVEPHYNPYVSSAFFIAMCKSTGWVIYGCTILEHEAKITYPVAAFSTKEEALEGLRKLMLDDPKYPKSDV